MHRSVFKFLLMSKGLKNLGYGSLTWGMSHNSLGSDDGKKAKGRYTGTSNLHCCRLGELVKYMGK